MFNTIIKLSWDMKCNVFLNWISIITISSKVLFAFLWTYRTISHWNVDIKPIFIRAAARWALDEFIKIIKLSLDNKCNVFRNWIWIINISTAISFIFYESSDHLFLNVDLKTIIIRAAAHGTCKCSIRSLSQV